MTPLEEAVKRLYVEMRLPEASTCLWCEGPAGTPKANETATFYEHSEDCAWMNLIKVADLGGRSEAPN